MINEKFSDGEKAVVEEYMGRIDQYRNAAVFGQGLVEISRAFGKLDLQEIESFLRRKKSLTTLIGLTIDTLPQFESRLPHTGEKRFPFYLYTTVNGPEEAEEMLLRNAITYEENFERLSETGLLVPKRGTELNKMIKSPLN